MVGRKTPLLNLNHKETLMTELQAFYLLLGICIGLGGFFSLLVVATTCGEIWEWYNEYRSTRTTRRNS